jgi:two-component system LytT family response regulator
MNCLIIDDEPIYRNLIKGMIELDSSLTLVGEYGDAATAYNEISNSPIDLLFLDINLPRINGIELAKIIAGKPTMIVFVTSETHHALEAFDLNVIDYLIKPITLPRFTKAIDKAKLLIKANSVMQRQPDDDFIFIRDSYTVRKIKLDDILYLEAKSNYVNIYLESDAYTIHSLIKTIEEKLPKRFLRIHRSFIINLSKISTIEGKNIIIGKNIIPVSDAYKAILSDRLNIL